MSFYKSRDALRVSFWPVMIISLQVIVATVHLIGLAEDLPEAFLAGGRHQQF